MTAESEGTRHLRGMVREAITNAYYETRNEGGTMEVAADRATESVMKIVASVDANADARGRVLGQVEAYQEVMLERTDEEEPFVAGLLAAASERAEVIQP